MLFNSIEFACFLPIALLVWALVARAGWETRKATLLAMSLVFAAAWHPSSALLLVAVGAWTFVAARVVEGGPTPGHRRRALAAGIAGILAALAWFKYRIFVGDTAHWIVGEPAPLHAALALPIGVSFYSFEAIAYLVAVSRGYPATRRPVDLGLFFGFFPHVVAGPIVRPADFLPQLDRAPSPSTAAIERGLARIAQGFAKKLLLADALGLYVDQTWSGLDVLPGGNLALAFYAYAFQIYFDFSGYTDIALGIATLFGLVLPENFARPYLASSPREFWRRWHITLSTWLRDYLYLPLGGDGRRGGHATRNLFVTMLLGGLWHGAAWHYVAWGAYHGALLAGDRALRGTVALPRWMTRAITFHLIAGGWILFRAPDLGRAAAAIARLGTPGMDWTIFAQQALVLTIVGAAMHLGPEARVWRERFVRLPAAVQGLAYGAMTALAFFLAPAGEQFIYFQF